MSMVPRFSQTYRRMLISIKNCMTRIVPITVKDAKNPFYHSIQMNMETVSAPMRIQKPSVPKIRNSMRFLLVGWVKIKRTALLLVQAFYAGVKSR